MTMIFVASSKTLGVWGASVGISKSLYKVGLADDPADAIEALNEAAVAGAADWTQVGAADAGDLDQETLDVRFAAAGILVDPAYYPKLRRAGGIVRVRPETVENSMLVERAMANESNLDLKIKPADIAAWLIRLAQRS